MSAVLITSSQFHTMLGISQASFFRLRSMGKIGPRPIKLGKSVRWDEVEVKEWIAAKCPNARQWQSR
jgi:predicted DNA-binding transcriptional regulator AlpA